MKKIMLVMPNKGYSGAEKVVLDIVRYLKNDYEFVYVSESGEIDKYLEEENIRHIITNKNLNIKEMKKIIKEEQPDIIHCSDYRASTKVALINTNVPIISHLHNNALWLKKICINSIIYLIASKKFSKILTVSDSIEKEYIFSQFIKNKILMVDNPVSRENILMNIDKRLEKEYDVCFCGRLTEAKNPIRFINIIIKLREKFPDIKCIIIGDGELREECDNKIKQNHLEDNIKMCGFLKNPYNEMLKSKLFCLTSSWEGYGLVAFEALTLGLPCIVSDVGGLGSIVDEKCGKLCSSDDEFYEEIKKLLNDNKYFQEKVQNSIEKAQKIENIDEYMKKIKDTYEKL